MMQYVSVMIISASFGYNALLFFVLVLVLSLSLARLEVFFVAVVMVLVVVFCFKNDETKSVYVDIIDAVNAARIPNPMSGRL